MIKHLELKNILLFDSLKIQWNQGLTILTGETGSGKSIIFSVLGWILGEKVDLSPLRENESTGFIEALFDIKDNSLAQKCLKEESITVDTELLIRREFSSNGKSRVFINDQQCSLSFLRLLGTSLAERVGQNAHKELVSTSYQMAILDLYGHLEKERDDFSFHWAKMQETTALLNQTLAEQENKKEEEERLKIALDEIKKLSLKPQEEETLCQEEKIVRRSNEIEEKIVSILEMVVDTNPSIISGLKTIYAQLSSIAYASSVFASNLTLLANIIVELEEFLHEIRQQQGRFVPLPERLSQIEERLNQIFKIKRKYGESDEALLSFQKKGKERLATLESFEDRILDLKEKLSFYQKQCDLLASLLSEKRKKAALDLEKKIDKELVHLNMEKAHFTIVLQKKERSEMGDEEVVFFLTPNVGEKTSPLSQCASGGEMARIAFALKILLSEKNRTPLLLFDEIDANVGGTTATIIGEKLSELAEKKQLFAITHFVQVAKCATTHLFVSKEERKGRTLSSVKELSQKEKEKEYLRMIGQNAAYQGSKTKEFINVL